jgi:hypothetical protein
MPPSQTQSNTTVDTLRCSGRNVGTIVDYRPPQISFNETKRNNNVEEEPIMLPIQHYINMKSNTIPRSIGTMGKSVRRNRIGIVCSS